MYCLQFKISFLCFVLFALIYAEQGQHSGDDFIKLRETITSGFHFMEKTHYNTAIEVFKNALNDTAGLLKSLKQEETPEKSLQLTNQKILLKETDSYSIKSRKLLKAALNSYLVGNFKLSTEHLKELQQLLREVREELITRRNRNKKKSNPDLDAVIKDIKIISNRLVSMDTAQQKLSRNISVISNNITSNKRDSHDYSNLAGQINNLDRKYNRLKQEILNLSNLHKRMLSAQKKSGERNFSRLKNHYDKLAGLLQTNMLGMKKRYKQVEQHLLSNRQQLKKVNTLPLQIKKNSREIEQLVSFFKQQQQTLDNELKNYIAASDKKLQQTLYTEIYENINRQLFCYLLAFLFIILTAAAGYFIYRKYSRQVAQADIGYMQRYFKKSKSGKKRENKNWRADRS